MKCDSIPYELQPVFVPIISFFPQKFTCCVGTIDLKALVLGHEFAGLIPAEIMEDGCYCMNFAVAALEFGGFRGDYRSP